MAAARSARMFPRGCQKLNMPVRGDTAASAGPAAEPRNNAKETGMKRSLAKPAAGATAVLLLSLTAAACSSSSSSSAAGGSSATSSSTGGSARGKNYKKTVIQGGARDGLYVTKGRRIHAPAKKNGNNTRQKHG